jgi:hypothetical protein
MWDDSKYNKSNKGDIFIIWRYNIGVTYHRITDIKDPKDRLPSWSSNVGQEDRQVIFISKQIHKMNWDEWIDIDGASRCMGTAAVLKNKKKIINR